MNLESLVAVRSAARSFLPSVTRNGLVKYLRLMRQLLTGRLGRPVLVFAGKGGGDEKPHHRERHVERSEGRQHESESGPGVNDAGLQHISEAHEERVDRGFC